MSLDSTRSAATTEEFSPALAATLKPLRSVFWKAEYFSPQMAPESLIAELSMVKCEESAVASGMGSGLSSPMEQADMVRPATAREAMASSDFFM